MKVLIISHNALITFDNMGKTLLSLFSSFEKNELCQLYVYPSVPNSDRCSSYFRITDKDILKSYFTAKVCSCEVYPDKNVNSIYEFKSDRSLYNNTKNRSPLRLLARDFMWRFSAWNNKSLKRWLNREKPDCIFVAPGKSKFIYDIALNISKKYKIPIVSYLCDEFYFVSAGQVFFERILRTCLKKKIEKLIAQSCCVITICNEAAEKYEKEFNCSTTTIMTGSSILKDEETASNTISNTITYMGNISSNRYISLMDIGRELNEINIEKGTDYKLCIYSPEQNPIMIRPFDDIKAVEFCGFVTGEEYQKVFNSADIFVHVEAFDEKNIEKVKHSVSTKIADSLASGKCLFAYGPREVASMQHLIRNDCAIVATSREELKSVLKNALEDSELRKRVTENAVETAKRYHNSEVNSRLLKEVLQKAVESSKNNV